MLITALLIVIIIILLVWFRYKREKFIEHATADPLLAIRQPTTYIQPTSISQPTYIKTPIRQPATQYKPATTGFTLPSIDVATRPTTFIVATRPPVITRPPVVSPPITTRPPVVSPPVITQPPVVSPPVVSPPTISPPVVSTDIPRGDPTKLRTTLISLESRPSRALWITNVENAFVGSIADDGSSIYPCRSNYGRGIYAGRSWTNHPACNIPAGGKEVVSTPFKYLRDGNYEWTRERPSNPIVGGNVSGTNQYICRGHLYGNDQIGYVRNGDLGCNIAYNGITQIVPNYEWLGNDSATLEQSTSSPIITSFIRK